ncbi:helix-hairpin-helix domain-containing protein [Micromonospora chalcea]|uniref:helix-hairpin-helix domain-containing protein n=1 Tax=Micromonospora chalcea TaxID=1874 RepID=UPI003454C2DB
MPSSFGQWLFVILALLIGLVAGWVLFGRRPGAPATPTVEGAPAVTATVDEPRPVAVVDEPPATATVTEPAPTESATAEPAVATAARTADEPAESSPAASDPVGSEPATAEPVASEPVVSAPVASERVESEPVGAEPVSPSADAGPVAAPVADAEPAPATVDAHPVTVPAIVDAEPVAASATLAEDEPATEKQPAVGTAVDALATEAAPVEAIEPVAVPAPRTSVENVPAAADTDASDDFRRIQGIGPKLAAALQDAGIRTYRQLAELDEAALRQTVKAAGLRSAPGLATWPQQAKVLAGAGAEADRVLPAGAE